MVTDTTGVASLLGTARGALTRPKRVTAGFGDLLATTFRTRPAAGPEGIGPGSQGSGGCGACGDGGGTAKAASSLHRTEGPDLNGDGIVDLYDINQILTSMDTDAKGDVNGDGLTNQEDLDIALKLFGRKV